MMKAALYRIAPRIGNGADFSQRGNPFFARTYSIANLNSLGLFTMWFKIDYGNGVVLGPIWTTFKPSERYRPKSVKFVFHLNWNWCSTAILFEYLRILNPQISTIFYNSDWFLWIRSTQKWFSKCLAHWLHMKCMERRNALIKVVYIDSTRRRHSTHQRTMLASI